MVNLLYVLWPTIHAGGYIMCAILTLCTCENMLDTCLFSVLNVSHVALSDQYEVCSASTHSCGTFFFFFFEIEWFAFEIEWFAMGKLVLYLIVPVTDLIVRELAMEATSFVLLGFPWDLFSS